MSLRDDNSLYLLCRRSSQGADFATSFVHKGGEGALCEAERQHRYSCVSYGWAPTLTLQACGFLRHEACNPLDPVKSATRLANPSNRFKVRHEACKTIESLEFAMMLMTGSAKMLRLTASFAAWLSERGADSQPPRQEAPFSVSAQTSLLSTIQPMCRKWSVGEL